MKVNIKKYESLVLRFLLLLLTFFSTYPNLKAQIIIPYATQQPKWVFPLWFQDGAGERDTMYIAYQPGAAGNDTIFGEKYLQIDTSKFNVTVWMQGDSAKKVVVRDSGDLPGYVTIEFTKGVMPLTMYWLDSLFYSDNISYADSSPAPRAKGILECCNDIYCVDDAFIVMTDTVFIVQGVYTFSDSIVFQGNAPGSISMCMNIRIVPWDWGFVSVEGQFAVDNELASIYPNPTSEYIVISNNSNELIEFLIIDVLGNEIIRSSGLIVQETIRISGLVNGIYFVKISSQKGEVITKKFMKF